MRGVIRDLAFGLRSLAEEPRGALLVLGAGVLAGALSLAVWTHIDAAVLGSLEPIEVGGLYAVTPPAWTPARAVFWSEPVSTRTGACRGPASLSASHVDDGSSWLERLDWSPRPTPALPAPADTRTIEEQELNPCQLEV